MKQKDKTHYTEMVYDCVAHIPYGRVTTYGLIANFLTLGSARMVGWALNKCHLLERNIPAHRVVNRKGELSGRLHFGDHDTMANRLIKEGISVKDNKIQDFDKYLWNPEEIMLNNS